MNTPHAYRWLLLLVLCGWQGGWHDAIAAEVLPLASGKNPLLAQSQRTAPPPASRAEDGPVTLRAELSHAAYVPFTPDKLLLKVDFACAPVLLTNRPPLNLALVLDRSGSMAEVSKFPYLVEAAREIIANLSSRDVVSLIAYSDRATALSPAGRAVNKPFLYHRLEEVWPEGYADLSAGLLESIAQVNSQSAGGQTKQVLLVTDGRANRGVTEPAELRRIVENARAKGIRLSVLGCGTNVNEKLLTDLAAAGGGRYLFVKSPEQLPGMLRGELGGLLPVVAQNTRLEVSIARGGTINKVFGQLLDQTETSHEFQIGNLRAGDYGTVLLALKPSDFKPGATLEAAVRLTYDDPATSGRVERVAPARAVFSTGTDTNALQGNQEVILYGGILQTLEWAIEGVEGFDQERYRQALTGLAQWYGPARQFALNTRNQDLLNQTFLLKHFLEEMEAAQKEGKMHEHAEARGQLPKESDYQRYLLFHHKEVAAKAESP